MSALHSPASLSFSPPLTSPLLPHFFPPFPSSVPPLLFHPPSFKQIITFFWYLQQVFTWNIRMIDSVQEGLHIQNIGLLFMKIAVYETTRLLKSKVVGTDVVPLDGLNCNPF